MPGESFDVRHGDQILLLCDSIICFRPSLTACARRASGASASIRTPPRRSCWPGSSRRSERSSRGSSGTWRISTSSAGERKEEICAILRFVKWCLFIDRLAPYFNGENHVERIRYHENVSREAIENIVHVFASVRKKTPIIQALLRA